MNRGTERILSRLLYFSIFIYISAAGFSQNYEIKDTSYFISWDDDFNLIMSADKGDTANVRLLLDRGADINTSTIDGVTPLLYAAQNGNLIMVKMLADSGADLNKAPYDGATALINAAKLNFYDIAEYLVTKKADLNIRDHEKVTAVHYAAAYNNFDIMDMLIYNGADIELPDARGNTPIISAAFSGSYEAVELLIANGADINSADNSGNTALMVAVQQQDTDIIYLLLDNGADVNKANNAGMTALAMAAGGDPVIAKILIESGADINRGTGTQGVIDIARKNKNTELTTYLDSLGAQSSRKADWDMAYFGLYLDFNNTDYMNGLEMGAADSKYQLGVNWGFVFRPSANRVVADISDVRYQFWERRYWFYLGLEKRFRIVKTYRGLETGPYLGARELITWGGYRGSKMNPPVRLITSPSAGWFMTVRGFGIRADYHYLNFKTPEISRHRFSISFFFNNGRDTNKMKYKKIDWLD